jgi:hypothetical protein
VSDENSSANKSLMTNRRHLTVLRLEGKSDVVTTPKLHFQRRSLTFVVRLAPLERQSN